ncbi:MAG: tRNA lysidine(34) synthetase TilS [Phycisphaerales bacterium]|nr:tRNA lysidine(34) synthetase TilS [Phycisphaerales bacterium]
MPAPTGLVQQLDQRLHRHELMEPGARIIIACSGGCDSVALLRLLQSVNQSKHWRWQIMVAHVNHNLRQAASRGDERFVRKLAARLDLPCAVEQLPRPKQGVTRSEAHLRQSRYGALAKIARRYRCSYIAVAHHADDQAETVLLRILRGAGPQGLSAMAERCELGDAVAEESGPRGGKSTRPIHLVRPLLTFTRANLEHYLNNIGQPWRSDHTNAQDIYLRNRIRNQLLPLMRQLQPDIYDRLVSLAATQRGAAEALRVYTAQLRRAARPRRTTNGWSLDRTKLAAGPAFLAAAVLRDLMGELSVPLDRINRSSLTQAVELLKKKGQALRYQFAGGIVLTAKGGHSPTAQRLHLSKQSGRVFSRGAAGTAPSRRSKP